MLKNFYNQKKLGLRDISHLIFYVWVLRFAFSVQLNFEMIYLENANKNVLAVYF